MIPFIRNENMKIYKRTRTWVMAAVLLLYVLLQIINSRTAGSDTANGNWRATLEQENVQSQMEAAKPDALNIEIRQAEKHMLLNQYYLDKNTPPSYLVFCCLQQLYWHRFCWGALFSGSAD
ncbi:hypothetical protein [Paenibacillus sp. HW567]|uniref:hypothetical protein n=1 Tax=Paenibacillus sp. HW567 TaxID=1034769 RepID=UPI0003A68262|nr:hypothetical protein [Paenibacillus sp. HW567]